ncbi:MAG TPA: hypothetical protein VN911_18745 [Candidatus Acidoferrum sp.]|nr:hypothetical protein [Candidatus Acidoferrum sp.]
MKSAWKMCAILFLATSLVAQSNTEPKRKRPKAPPITAADVQALRDAIASQQAALAQQQREIQELRDTLRGKDQAVQAAQATAVDAAGKADAAQAQASQQQQSVVALTSDVSDLKTNLLNTTVTVQETQKRVSEPPTTIHYKGITLSPGGFLAAETVTRTRALASDVNTPFNSLTLPGASQSSMTEFFGSGRQSRISLLGQGDLGSMKIGGYVEADFLSAGVTSNNNQSNSYTFRQRQAFAQAALNSGWTFTGGQMWSLVTETKKGTDNRSEALPMTIDAQYTVGFSWARQYGFRVSKNISNKIWLAASVEESQATITSHGNVNNFLVGSAGNAGGLYNSAGTSALANVANYAFNPSPDVVAKVVFEPGFGHYEVFGIYSRFRDRVFPCVDVSATAFCGGSATAGPNVIFANNISKNGGGVGANARWSFDHKHIDFGLHALAGDGVGRYGTGGLSDASIRADGSLNLMREYQGLTTLEWHGPKLDVYFNVGSEYAKRTFDFDPVTGKQVGYGAPTFANNGCYLETEPGATVAGFTPGGLANCTGDTRALIEGTAGFWHKIYDGSREQVNRGRLQWGLQYSYVDRITWSGKNGLEPEGLDNMFFTSFRYYLPQ